MFSLVSKSVQTVIKLSCVYLTPERSVVCFEIIDVYWLQGGPKQERISTPLKEEDNTHSNVENELQL